MKIVTYVLLLFQDI